MGTHGVVSVVDGDNVLLKAITSQDGYNAAELVKRFLKVHAEMGIRPTPPEFYAMARAVGFGNADYLVVLGEDEEPVYADGGDIDPRFYASFDDPWANPAHPTGFAAYKRVIDLASSPPRVMGTPPKLRKKVKQRSNVRTLSNRIEKVHSGLRDIHAGRGRDRDHDATVLAAIGLLQDLQPIVQAFEPLSPKLRDLITEHPDTLEPLVKAGREKLKFEHGVQEAFAGTPWKSDAKPAEPQGLQILRSRETIRGIEVNHENIHDIVLLLPGSTGKPTQALYDAAGRFALLRVYIRDQLQQLVDGDWIVFEKADRDRDSCYSARAYGKGLLEDYEPVGPVEDTHGHCG